MMPSAFTSTRRYRAFSKFLKEKFGTRVYRVTVDGGFTCPNVDGRVAKGGCVYCDNESFNPNRRLPRKTIRGQIEWGIEKLAGRFGADKFLAYFQAATNTYGSIEKLRRLYDEALADPRIVGLFIGTRPDCVPEPVLDLIEEYAQRMYVCVELGLQSAHERSLAWMNRGHGVDAFFDAVDRCQRRPFDVCAHVILGLPNETRDDMLHTADVLAELPIQGVKIHNLHVVRDTPMEKMHAAGEVRMLEFDEYVGLVCDYLERLPAEVVIQRLTGDAPPSYLIAPTWCLEKGRILNAIDAEMARRDSWQGKLWSGRCAIPAYKRPLPIL